MDFFNILKLSGYPVNKAKHNYEKLLAHSNQTGWHEEKIWELFNYNNENNPFYRQLVGDSNILNWKDVPIISKTDLMGRFEDKLVPSVLKRKLYISRTSGSTGTPMMFARQSDFHVMVWLAVNRFYSKNGFNVNNKQARFYGVPLSGWIHYKEKLKDFLANRHRFVVFNLEDKIFEQWINAFKTGGFEVIYGYTNSIIQFSNYLSEKGIVLKNICPTLKACVVTSEMCSQQEQEQLVSNLGVDVFNEYGASEVCVMGFRKHDYWEVADEMVYLEVVDENGHLVEDGETGRLLVTLLHNKVTPIVRYDIGDLASIKRNGEKTIITSLQGRMNDMGILSSGKKVPGLTFYYAVHEAIGLDVRIKEHQVIQKDYDYFVVNISSEGSLSSDQEVAIRSAFKLYMEQGLKIDINQVDKIERSNMGKFKHFISEL